MTRPRRDRSGPTDLRRPEAAPFRRMRLAALAVGGPAALGCALLTVGAHVPSIGFLGHAGSVVLPQSAPRILLLSVAAAGLALWAGVGGRGARRITSRLIALTAGLAAVGAAAVIVRTLDTARANGVRVSLRQAISANPPDFPAGPDETEVYVTDLGERLQVSIYRPGTQAPQGGWPVLIYVHGGGWVSGSRLQRSADMRWFADHGWLVVSADYSLSSPRRHLWDRTVRQIGCAMAWTGANIGRYGGNPARLAMFGDSAGGALAINAAYMADRGGLQPVCGGAVPRVSAISAAYPALDATGFHDNRDSYLGAYARRMTTAYLGGSPQQVPERYAAVTSATYISPAAPPTLLLVGENDRLVPPEGAYDFAAKARRAGVEVRLIRVPYADHSFDARPGVLNQLVRQTTLAFLERHAGGGAGQPAVRP